MILNETVFYRGSEVGLILEDLDAGRVRFKPNEGNKRLAGRIWRNSSQARKDIISYYRRRDKFVAK